MVFVRSRLIEAENREKLNAASELAQTDPMPSFSWSDLEGQDSQSAMSESDIEDDAFLALDDGDTPSPTPL